MLVINILIILFTIVVLMALHELGHFLMAKKFGVGVEEFGIGYPPRIFGKKIGKTIYSLNLIPFGAFVKIVGEEGGVESENSFSKKPVWQRSLIVLGGVISFWIISFILFTLIAGVWGIEKEVPQNAVLQDKNPQIVITYISPASPAEKAGIKIGDVVTTIGLADNSGGKHNCQKISQIKDIQQFVGQNLGKKIVLTVKRGNKENDIFLVPRKSPPKGEGAVGIGMSRIIKEKYSWWQAPLEGALITARVTIKIPVSLAELVVKHFKGEKMSGVEIVGPVGVAQIMNQFLNYGIDKFLFLVSVISIWLAIFNALPIPALDGGRFLFLVIEGIRKRPIRQEIEQKVTAAFFIALILLMVVVTIMDVVRLF